MAQQDKGRSPGLLARLLNVEPGEVPAVAASLLMFFLLFTGYFMLRPVRETMGVASGPETLQLAFHWHLRRDGGCPSSLWLGSFEGFSPIDLAMDLWVFRREPAWVCRSPRRPAGQRLDRPRLLHLALCVQPFGSVAGLERLGRHFRDQAGETPLRPDRRRSQLRRADRADFRDAAGRADRTRRSLGLFGIAADG